MPMNLLVLKGLQDNLNIIIQQHKIRRLKEYIELIVLKWTYLFQDLNYLNRDLSKVIMIDWNKDAYKFNPENGFQLKQWNGDENDVALGELADFLRGW